MSVTVVVDVYHRGGRRSSPWWQTFVTMVVDKTTYERVHISPQKIKYHIYVIMVIHFTLYLDKQRTAPFLTFLCHLNYNQALRDTPTQLVNTNLKKSCHHFSHISYRGRSVVFKKNLHLHPIKKI